MTTSPIRVDHLPTPDLVALAALKLMVEVEAAPRDAFEVAEPASRDWLLGYLTEGPGAIGPDPVDASNLGRARAWQVEIGRQRRMAELYRAPSRDGLSDSGARALETFAALAAVEAESEPELWVDVSDVLEVAPARRSRPSRPDSVVVTPVSPAPGFTAGPSSAPLRGAESAAPRPASSGLRPGRPGFVASSDPWSLPLEVTATQMFAA